MSDLLASVFAHYVQSRLIITRKCGDCNSTGPVIGTIMSTYWQTLKYISQNDQSLSLSEEITETTDESDVTIIDEGGLRAIVQKHAKILILNLKHETEYIPPPQKACIT
jgi:hypothetical protein